jgi:hypothetical protein
MEERPEAGRKREKKTSVLVAYSVFKNGPQKGCLSKSVNT